MIESVSGPAGAELDISQIAKYPLFAICELLVTAMHVISRRKLREAADQHRELEGPLDAWFRIAKKARWRNFAEIRKTFRSADAVGKWTVFNIKGNQYRLITEINFQSGRIFIRHVLTHGQYDRGGWKR